MSTLVKAPRPIGPQREGIVIQDAPGIFNGWQRRCLSCGCSVDAQHVAGSEDCQFLQDERYWKRATDV